MPVAVEPVNSDVATPRYIAVDEGKCARYDAWKKSVSVPVVVIDLWYVSEVEMVVLYGFDGHVLVILIEGVAGYCVVLDVGEDKCVFVHVELIVVYGIVCCGLVEFDADVALVGDAVLCDDVVVGVFAIDANTIF